MTLREKLNKIYDSVDFIPKLGYNKAQSYKFMRSADVTIALRKQLLEQRVYVEVNFFFEGAPYTIAREKAPNAPFSAVNVRCTLTFHDLDSLEILTASGLGSGADLGDKAAYKAETGALKYALKNAFLVPDEADAEADDSTDENARPSGEMPDFQEAKHDAPKLGVAQKTKGRPTPAASGATAAATNPAPAPAGPPKANVPTEAPATVTPSTTEETTSKSATSTTPREPGDESETDSAMPSESDLDSYRKAFQKLGDDLSTEGGLKSSPKLPIERKLLVFLLSITKAGSPKEITNVQWKNFFARVEAAKAAKGVGIKGITVLVNRASGIEPKEKK